MSKKLKKTTFSIISNHLNNHICIFWQNGIFGPATCVGPNGTFNDLCHFQYVYIKRFTFPGSSLLLATFMKHLFRDKLCRIEFCKKEDNIILLQQNNMQTTQKICGVDLTFIHKIKTKLHGTCNSTSSKHILATFNSKSHTLPSKHCFDLYIDNIGGSLSPLHFSQRSTLYMYMQEIWQFSSKDAFHYQFCMWLSMMPYTCLLV